MPLSEPIKLRLDVEMYESLHHEGVIRDKKMPELIREKLTFLSRLEGELNGMRREIEGELFSLQNRLDDLDGGSQEGTQSASFRVQYETLLLLRKMGGVPVINHAHKEMKRQGIEVYNPDKA